MSFNKTINKIKYQISNVKLQNKIILLLTINIIIQKS